MRNLTFLDRIGSGKFLTHNCYKENHTDKLQLIILYQMCKFY